MGWFSRWQGRQKEIASGVDAELIEQNRKRYKLPFRLLLCAFVCLGIAALKLPHLLHEAAAWLAAALFIVWMFLLKWVRAERWQLERPGPAEPPSIWKFRSRR